MESQERDTGVHIKPSARPFVFGFLLLAYTASLLYGLMGSWQTRWFRPDLLIYPGVMSVVYLELFALNAVRLGYRCLLPTLLVMLLSCVPEVAVQEFRFPDRLSPDVRWRLPVQPWDERYMLAIGAVVYLLIVGRAIRLYRRQRESNQ